MSPSLSTSLWCTATLPREWESLAITRSDTFTHTQASLHSKFFMEIKIRIKSVVKYVMGVCLLLESVL